MMMTATAAAAPAVMAAATAAVTKRREDLMEEEAGNEEASCSALNRKSQTSSDESQPKSRRDWCKDRDKVKTKLELNWRKIQEGASLPECATASDGLQRLQTGKHSQELEIKGNSDYLDSGNLGQLSQWCILNPFRRLRAAASGRRTSL
jgi:hypothetical protein